MAIGVRVHQRANNHGAALVAEPARPSRDFDPLQIHDLTPDQEQVFDIGVGADTALVLVGAQPHLEQGVADREERFLRVVLYACEGRVVVSEPHYPKRTQQPVDLS